METDRRNTGVQETGSPVPLARVLSQSEQVQGKVEECAVDLAAVNTALGGHVGKDVALQDVVGALELSIDIEAKVQEAAADLVMVNDALAAEIDERQSLEDELDRNKAALAVSRLQEKRARHDALHDAITGLPNATLFNDRLENALAQARRHSWQVAVMFIDLDNFKEINDTHGHEIGDDVLRVVAGRLHAFVRDEDTVCRRSGDEFLYLMLEAKDEDNARTMAQRLTLTIGAPIEVEGVKLSVRASLGLAMFPANGASPAELLKHADLSMYADKRQLSAAVPSQLA